MHQRLRIAFSKRIGLLQTDIDACDAAVRHLRNCKVCKTDEDLCPEGATLYQAFQVANARAKLLVGDTPDVVL